MISKEMKYDLHYGDVRGDVILPPHGSIVFLPQYSVLVGL